MGTETRTQSVDAVIHTLARRQHGAVARVQLLARGISDHAIRLRVRDGRLRPVHRGVYLVGPTVAPLGRHAAAILACEGAVISHRSAAALHGILAYPDAGDIWITTMARERSGHRGLVTRTTKTLRPADVSRHQRIPVTTAARTILDLSAIVEIEKLEHACAEAHALKLAFEPDLREQLAYNRGKRGAARLRRLLDRSRRPARVRSRLERELLKLIRASDLPEPETEQWIGPYLVDFVWWAERLVVETDGLAFHEHDRAQRRDRARTNDLQLRGYLVLRFTWAEVTQQPDWVLDEIARGLTRAR
jgi:very-short-patch-repair endonuclease